MSANGEEHILRRALDRAVYLYPLLAGIIVCLVGLGGYMATVRYVCEDLKSIHETEKSHDALDKVTAETLYRVVTLQETQDKRINRLEEWRDHPFQLHGERRTQLQNVRYDVDGRDG